MAFGFRVLRFLGLLKLMRVSVDIVSSRTHGLFVHLSQCRNVGKTLIYVYKRIKNTPRALGAQRRRRYNDIPTLHHGTARFARVTKRSVNADYPSLTLHRRQNRPVRVVKYCSVDAKGCRRTKLTRQWGESQKIILTKK